MKHFFSRKLIALCWMATVSCANSNQNKVAVQQTVGLQIQVQPGQEVATFAGGCFWCTEAVFERLVGVDKVISGYSGGDSTTANYKDVSSGRTGHAEAIQIYYNPLAITFDELLEVFFLVAHDPTQMNRQGADVGTQYRSAVFYHNDAQQKAALGLIDSLENEWADKGKIVTEVVPYEDFYPAEEYHQDYLPANLTNPYIQNVALPKVEKLESKYKAKLKPKYQE